MKVIGLLLVFIVIALTITPCCAIGEQDTCALETVEKGKTEHTESSNDCSKGCSPFYRCGSCGGVTFSMLYVLTFAIQVPTVTHNTQYNAVQLPLIPITIWQPPKLS